MNSSLWWALLAHFALSYDETKWDYANYVLRPDEVAEFFTGEHWAAQDIRELGLPGDMPIMEIMCSSHLVRARDGGIWIYSEFVRNPDEQIARDFLHLLERLLINPHFLTDVDETRIWNKFEPPCPWHETDRLSR